MSLLNFHMVGENHFSDDHYSADDTLEFADKLNYSLEVIDKTLRIYSPYNSNLMLSFNGGKDCTTLLHLLLSRLLWNYKQCLNKSLDHETSSANIPPHSTQVSYDGIFVHDSCSHGSNNLCSSQATIPILQPAHKICKIGILLIHVQGKEEFSEVEGFSNEFLRAASEFCDRERLPVLLELVEISAKSQREAIGNLHRERPSVQAILMGTRRTDPHSGDLSAFSRTDADWADGELMRVLPLLEWSYADVWHYARSRRVPYCVLYERGYSSLGSRHSTRPNPRLLVRPSTDSSSTSTTGLSTSTSTSTDSTKPVYRPAYELPDADAEERRGRLHGNRAATATSSRSSN